MFNQKWNLKIHERKVFYLLEVEFKKNLESRFRIWTGTFLNYELKNTI